jgi:glycosidase
MPMGVPQIPPLRKHPHLYEINTWLWLDELSKRAGRRITLGEIPENEWDRLAALGFDLVWLMGVWQRSPLARRLARQDPNDQHEFDISRPGWKLEDVVGSPYAVQDYRPDPRIGVSVDLDLVRTKVNDRGMRLILDFVSNHTALDHPWIETHPEYYVRGSLDDFRRDPGAFFLVEHANGGCDLIARGRDPYFPPWKDTAQLNFFEPTARKAIMNQLREVARHCDGLRCDMAMLLLNDIFERVWRSYLGTAKRPITEFWAEARNWLPETILIAEAYWDTEQTLIDLGFSFCYDKHFYDALRAGDAAGLRAKLRASPGFQARMVHFLENHDEQRSAAIFGSRLEAAGALMATVPGMHFYHQGQFEGRRIHFPIPLGSAADETPDAATEAFYRKILSLTRDDAFHFGEWRTRECEPTGGPNGLVCHEWRMPKSWKLVVANIADAPSEGQIRFGEELQRDRNYIFFDALHDARYARNGSELRDRGLYVRLDPWRAHLFDITTA